MMENAEQQRAGAFGASWTSGGQLECLRHIPQKMLARRWNVSTRTLERWRVRGTGPAFLKLNGRVTYRLADVEAFEAERLHASTSERVAGRAS